MSSHAHTHAHTHDPRHATSNDRTDPSRTSTLQARYEASLLDRYQLVIDEITRLVGEQDVFNLGDSSSEFAEQKRAPGKTPVDVSKLPPIPKYDFPTDSSGVREFRDWVDASTDAVVLGGPYGGSVDAAGWTEDYIRHGYFRGATHADASLRAGGFTSVSSFDVEDMFNLPIHRSTLSLLHERQFVLLRGVNADMGKEVSRILSDSFLEGVGPGEAASRLSTRLPSIARPRAQTIARTEIMNAHSTATLNRFESIFGSGATVTAVVEFSSAGDRRVCPECESLEGQAFTIARARGVIPVHPNCRCVWIPIPDGAEPSDVVLPWERPDPDADTGPGLTDVVSIPYPSDSAAKEVWRTAAESRWQKVVGGSDYQSLDELLSEADDFAHDLVDVQTIDARIRAPSGRVQQILDSGRFKSQFETKTSSGMLDGDYRAEFEEWAFGYARDLDPTERPIYGYLGTRGVIGEPMAGSYGNVVFRLRDDVLRRTSFTDGDSLYEKYDAPFVPRPVLAPDHRALSSYRVSGTGDTPFGSPDIVERARRQYVEAQYHGGVSLDDVEEVLYQLHSRDAKAPETVIEVLDAARDAGLPARAAINEYSGEISPELRRRITEAGYEIVDVGEGS